MSELPWNEALLRANKAQADRLAEAEEEIKTLKVTIVNLKRRLREAKHRQANWLLRQQAWRHERRELLGRLATASAERRTPFDP